MNLPPELQQAIEAEIATFPRSTLARASAALTQRYKSPENSPPSIKDSQSRAAYLAARLPATFAAVSRVLSEICKLRPEIEIDSLLDLGSGPGTALWAAAEILPSLQRATLMESETSWIEAGRRLAAHSAHIAVRQAEWIRQDLRTPSDLPASDLVVISYALGELAVSARESLVHRALRATAKFLAIIEPGTMRGFELIHGVRSALIAANVGILAPCPHREICPLAAAGDWCHFSQRVERSSLHRQIKSAELAYEDEKFSYIVADKSSTPASGGGRIVRHPQKHSGHVQLTLCTSRGIEHRTVARSDKANYRLARQAQWGDLWPE